MKRAEPIETAVEILRERYAGADSAFLSGSVIRGDATATSDLDVVVLMPHVERSYRESFYALGWPVETFVHDEETIEYYFIEKDLPSGVSAIMHMVCDGVAVPARTPLNERIKARADALVAAGPPAIPRRLAAVDASFAQRFDAAFAAAFEGRHAALFGLADEVLAPTGGRLFDGYRATSDPAWRRAPPR